MRIGIGAHISISGVRPLSPKSITGVVLWLDASDISTLYQDSAGSTPVASNADPVGKWADKSTAGKHATQATSTKRFTYASGSYPYVVGDAVDDNLSCASITSSGDWTLCAVFTRAATTADNIYYLLGTPDGGLYTHGSAVSQKWGLFTGTISGANTTVSGKNLVTVVKSGTDYTYYLNGSSDGSRTGTAIQLTTPDIGNRNGFALYNATKVHEITVHNSAVSGANLTALMAYERSKWGTP